MSNLALNAVWQHSKAKGTHRLVLLSLADQADDHGWCWPPHKNVMKRTLMSRRTVQRSLKRLQEAGELAIVMREGTSNLYRIICGELAEGDHPAPPRIADWIKERDGYRSGAVEECQLDTPPGAEGERQDDHPTGVPSTAPPAPTSRREGRASQETREPSLTPIDPLEEPSSFSSEADGWPTAAEAVIEEIEDRTVAGIVEEADPHGNTRSDLVVVDPEIEADVRSDVFGPCQRPLCDRGFGHKGQHRDMWFEAVGIALRQKIGKRLESRAGQLARMVEEEGLPPEEIPRRAGVLLAEWGPSKLTINSLREHWDWAGSDLREVSESDVRRHIDEMNRAERIRRLTGAPAPALPSVGPDETEEDHHDNT